MTVSVKPRVIMVALTSYNCLTRADNTSPFRWMGLWCAVYAPPCQMKAKRRAERSRARRGTKKRGRGSTLRRKAERAIASRERRTVRDPARGAAKAERARKRIDYLYDRAYTHACRVSILRRRIEVRWNEVRDQISRSRADFLDPNPILIRRRTSLWSRITGLRSREIRVFSGIWGLPKNATWQRIKLLSPQHPALRAIPRRTLEEWAEIGVLEGHQMWAAHSRGITAQQLNSNLSQRVSRGARGGRRGGGRPPRSGGSERNQRDLGRCEGCGAVLGRTHLDPACPVRVRNAARRRTSTS